VFLYWSATFMMPPGGVRRIDRRPALADSLAIKVEVYLPRGFNRLRPFLSPYLRVI
jgi:hypothetical protein